MTKSVRHGARGIDRADDRIVPLPLLAASLDSLSWRQEHAAATREPNTHPTPAGEYAKTTPASGNQSTVSAAGLLVAFRADSSFTDASRLRGARPHPDPPTLPLCVPIRLIAKTFRRRLPAKLAARRNRQNGTLARPRSVQTTNWPEPRPPASPPIESLAPPTKVRETPETARADQPWMNWVGSRIAVASSLLK